MGRVTIADVAERTGFSKTTISRFLNGKYELRVNVSAKLLRILNISQIAWREAYGFNKVI